MNSIMIYSQDGLIQIEPTLVSVGHRQEVMVIGDKLQKIMDDKKMTPDDLIKEVGNSYRDNINRILNNEEIPNPKMISKLVKFFNVEDDFFKDKELDNVVMVQNGIVVGSYETNKRAKEVNEEIHKIREDAFINNKRVVYKMPKE